MMKFLIITILLPVILWILFHDGEIDCPGGHEFYGTRLNLTRKGGLAYHLFGHFKVYVDPVSEDDYCFLSQSHRLVCGAAGPGTINIQHRFLWLTKRCIISLPKNRGKFGILASSLNLN